MSAEQEMNEALDALEADAGEAFDKEEDLNLADENLETKDIEPKDEIIEDKPKEKPPGYLTYDEWIAKGKDPADFRGENAYISQYESLKEGRLDNKFKGLNCPKCGLKAPANGTDITYMQDLFTKAKFNMLISVCVKCGFELLIGVREE